MDPFVRTLMFGCALSAATLANGLALGPPSLPLTNLSQPAPLLNEVSPSSDMRRLRQRRAARQREEERDDEELAVLEVMELAAVAESRPHYYW